MVAKTLKIDIKTATTVNQNVGNLARKTQEILNQTNFVYENTLPYMKGKSRKVYEKQAQQYFESCQKNIDDMFAMGQIIQDVAKSYLHFDVSRSR